MQEKIVQRLKDHIILIEDISKDQDLLTGVEAIAREIIDSFNKGKKVLLFGCGGSASDSQHIAAEFINRLNFNRKSLPAIALTTDTSILTAIGNDFKFDYIFKRQVEALADEGDVVVGISTSGKSNSVLEALKTARGMGAKTVLMTGKTPAKNIVNHIIKVPSDTTTLIQEAHIAIFHIICTIVEDELFR
jgi:D-sedoheptulose 7-phosphate isomerase